MPREARMRNTRTMHSLRRFGTVCFNIVSRRASAACALIALSLLPASTQENTIRTRVNLVVAPTTVTDREGKFIDGLQASDFIVLDNGRPRTIQMDTSDIALTPISLVIAVQGNGMSRAALAKIRKVGSMVEPLITGERGEAAIVRFSDQVEVMQDFTRNPDLIAKAFSGLKSRGSGARSIDAVAQAIEMLTARADNRRRVVLIIAESRDRGSRAKLTGVLQSAQRANVTLYPITFSVHATPWTAKPEDAVPAEGGFNILGVVAELARLGTTNTAEEMARFTGGRRVSFLTLKGLESEIGHLGEELHSQYLLSFTAAGEDGVFHVLDVKVKAQPDAIIRTRPGYWN